MAEILWWRQGLIWQFRRVDRYLGPRYICCRVASVMLSRRGFPEGVREGQFIARPQDRVCQLLGQTIIAIPEERLSLVLSDLFGFHVSATWPDLSGGTADRLHPSAKAICKGLIGAQVLGQASEMRHRLRVLAKHSVTCVCSPPS